MLANANADYSTIQTRYPTKQKMDGGATFRLGTHGAVLYNLARAIAPSLPTTARIPGI